MDESWRVRMGTPIMAAAASLPRWRRSSTSSFADPEALDPEDFADVFGGPPRSVYWRKMSGEIFSAGGNSFYEEIFRPPEINNTGEFAGRGLPAFRIPGTSERFYSDVFGSDSAGEERRSRERWKAKSKSTSSSVLSSEDMSPLRPAIGGDHVAFADFASKLRPINVPSRRNTSSTSWSRKQKTMQSMNNFYTNNDRPINYSGHLESTGHYFDAETDYHHATHFNTFGRSHHHNNPNNNNYYFGMSRRVVSTSPETTISLEPDSYPRSVKISVDDDVDDVDLNSPNSSPLSSLCHAAADHVVPPTREEEDGLVEDDDDDDDDEIMSSYVIEIGSDEQHYCREGTTTTTTTTTTATTCCDAVGIDEAIAWAKERFHSGGADKDSSNSTRQDQDHNNNVKDDQSFNTIDQGGTNEVCDGIVQSSPKMDMRVQDENIRLWSVGKETDIRLLLSTLHYILWNNSGWCAIAVTNLIESSQVKKAYQKARLCLHPDKLQQRGATFPQKYIADKAFSILQDAWATFISQEVSFTG